MASHVYPDYSRIIRVSHNNGDGSYSVATELVDGGDISGIVEDAQFTFGSEKGCCEGRLKVLAANADATLFKWNYPALLQPGDLVEAFPDAASLAEEEPWWTGVVLGPPTKDHNKDHYYHLEGLHIQIADKTIVNDGVVQYGKDSPLNSSVFYVSGSGLSGVVQNLCAGGTGPIVTDTNILAPNWTAAGMYDNMIYNNDVKISLLEYDIRAKLPDILDDLARMCPDDNGDHEANAWPVFWGVDHKRVFYFMFRPAIKIMEINTLFDLRYPEGKPVVTLNNVEVDVEEWEEIPGTEFRNQVHLLGNGLEKLYQHEASIAYYKRIKSDVQDVPTISTEGDALRWKAGYFQRYAYAQLNYRLGNLHIPSAAALPRPWLGYAQLTTPEVSGAAGQRTLTGFTLDFNESPVITDIVTGEMS